MAYAAGDEGEARRYFERTLDIEVDDPWCAALALQGGACIALMDGDAGRAARLLGKAASVRARIVAPPRPEERVFLEALAGRCQTILGEVAFSSETEVGAGMDLEAALRSARGEAESTISRSHDAAGAIEASDSPSALDLPGQGGGPAAHRISVSTLGPLEVSLHGRVVDQDAWSHGRPTELLVYLLAHPDGCTREQVGLVFWPEASAAQVKNSFHVLLHRLRRALGDQELVVVAGGRYRISPDADVWFDFPVFERAIEELLSGEATPSVAERLERALVLYRGPFMEGQPAGDWSVAFADRAHRAFTAGLYRLAQIRVEQGDGDAAIHALERLVREEPYREDAHRLLMTCLVRSGRRDRALQHFSRLVELLEGELRMLPEAETEALAGSIREGLPV